MANMELATSTEDAWIQENHELVDEALTEYRSSLAAIERLGLKTLSPGLRILIWALRVYVLFMVVVVVINVLHTLH